MGPPWPILSTVHPLQGPSSPRPILSTVVVEMLDPKNPHPGVFWLEEGVDGLGDEAVNRRRAFAMHCDGVAHMKAQGHNALRRDALAKG